MPSSQSYSAKLKIARRKRMNTSAIIMMVISMLFVWGGLVLSILHLMKNPEELDEVLEEVKDQHTL